TQFWPNSPNRTAFIPTREVATFVATFLETRVRLSTEVATKVATFEEKRIDCDTQDGIQGARLARSYYRATKLRWSTSTLPWSISGQDIAGGLSLDPPWPSDDTGSVWIGSLVEEQSLPAQGLASAARGTPITAPHVPALPRRGSERLGAGDASTQGPHRQSIGAAGSARVGTLGEIKIGPWRPRVNC
ncbi:hypothetical protein THAOC_06783, partial [Thalassiosira oceanica]